MSLHESGILKRLKAHHFRSLTETGCDPEFMVGSSALNAADVWPTFAIIGGGIIAATVCLLMEKMVCGRIRHLRQIKKAHVGATQPRLEDSQLSEIAEPGDAVPSTSNPVSNQTTPL